MATSTVKNVMIEFKSFDDDALRIRLDNPRDGITREQISAAYQKAFLEDWIICSKGSIADYIGEIVVETSTKVSLEGEDFYITPNTLSINLGSSTKGSGNLTVSGAQIQGYNVKNIAGKSDVEYIKATIKDNGLTATVTVQTTTSKDASGTFDLILVIRGKEVTVPCTISQHV